MTGKITVLWLVDERELPAAQDGRFRHVVGDARRPAATITGLLSEGAVLAVVRTEEDGERALAYGADEVVLAAELSDAGFEKAVARTTVRARARMHRDLFLIDLVRKDDTSALELLSAALGEELGGRLNRASADGKALADALAGEAEPARRAGELAETVAAAAQVVEKMQELLVTAPTDEVVDLAAVAREVARALTPAVRAVAAFDVAVPERPFPVGMPRWQVAMLVASLLQNAVESVAARGGEGRRVALRVLAVDGAAVLEVEDDGVGMDEDHRSYALDPFFTTSGRGRLGLGLTLTSARVRRAGGSLIIDSDEGEGTTVRVFLPLAGGLRLERPGN